MSSHYKGKLPHGLEPHHVVEHLPYNLGTACVYLMRSPYKHERPIEDCIKAIDHILFELERVGIGYDEVLHTIKQRRGVESDSGHLGAYGYQKEQTRSMEEVPECKSWS